MSYHSCRWCKWYQQEKCVSGAMRATTDEIYPFFEDGTLGESIRDGFCVPNLPEFERALSRTRLSKAMKEELLHTLHEDLEAQQVNWVEEIDESVSRALLAHEVDSRIEIEDPYSFYCKDFA